MRCLALAQAWELRGGRSVFLINQGASLVPKILAGRRDVLKVKGVLGSSEDLKSTLAALRGQPEGWTVVDGYHFSSCYLAGLADARVQFLQIDDLGKTAPYTALFVLNASSFPGDSKYKQRAPDTQLLLGPSYFLLRQEFLQRRSQRLVARSSKIRLLVTMGLADAQNATHLVLQALSALRSKSLEVVVILGAQNKQKKKLKSFATSESLPVEFVEDVRDMSEWMAWADLGLCAGGITSWELAAMGVPTVGIVLAENQRHSLDVLAKQGATQNLGDLERVTTTQLVKTLSNLLNSEANRRALGARGQQLIDGHGAARVLDRMEYPALHLRRAEQTDSRQYWEWANDPQVRASAFSSDPISWKTHDDWFAKKLCSPTSFLYIALDARELPVGQIRFDTEGSQAEIDLSVDAKARKQGLGPALLELGLRELSRATKVASVHAFVKSTNDPSKRAFEKAGFKRVEEVARHGTPTVHYQVDRIAEVKAA